MIVMKKMNPATKIRQHGCWTTPILVCLLLFLSVEGTAQNRWQTDLKAGVSTPVKKFWSNELKTGLGFDATIGYQVMPHLLLNTGWGWNHFSSDNTSDEYEETGYTVGLQFAHPIQRSPLRFLVGAAAVYKHIEVESTEGSLSYDTGHGWGWQADAGLSIPLGKQTGLTPFVRYHSLARDLKTGTTTTPGELQCLTGGLGISWRF